MKTLYITGLAVLIGGFVALGTNDTERIGLVTSMHLLFRGGSCSSHLLVISLF
jgi:hypothetical protein